MDKVLKKKKSINCSFSDRIFSLINTTFLIFMLLIVLCPLWYIICCSFSSGYAVSTGKVTFYPIEFNLEGYKAVFEYEPVLTGYFNSLIYTIFGTLLNVFMTILAAYPLSRKDMAGHGILTFIFTFTMFFSGGMIPSYLLVKDLGLLDTRWAMILLTALSVYNVIIAKTYFHSNIPTELLEAARIDGCNDFRFLISMVLPLSGAIIAVLTLFYAIGNWNSYFNALIYLNDRKLFPLQLALRDVLVANNFDAAQINLEDMASKNELKTLLKYSTIVASSLPLMIVYPFVQKHFVKGVMIGSLKG